MTDTDTLKMLTAHVDNVVHSLTWQGIAEAAAESSGDEPPAYVEGRWISEDGDELTADEAFHAHNQYDSPADAWMEAHGLEITVHETRTLYSGESTVDHVSVLCTYGGPNVWADWDGSRWHVHGHWGSEEVHRYMSGDEIGVGDYLNEVIATEEP